MNSICYSDYKNLQPVNLLHPRWWGHGLATRMSWTVMHQAFEAGHVEHIVAGADTPNTASVAVMRRLGMQVLRTVQYPLALRGRFFHKVLRMHTLCSLMAPLMSPGPSCRLRQGHGRLLGLLQRWHRGPGFWDKAALRQGLVTQQRHQQRHPPLTKHAH
jgi:hypothetical protein